MTRKASGYRKVTYKDICVLLRATSSLAPIYEKEIADLGLPVFSDISSTYLDSMEVQTIMSLLKMIDNPMQDIPLVTVLRSSIFNFNDDELIQIRLADKNNTFYEAMLKARLVVEKKLKDKIENVMSQIEKWQVETQYIALDELIWKLYKETGFYHYVSLLPNGGLRQANLKLLFEKAKQYEKASFKGLFNFINFIDKVKMGSNDMGAAKLIGENENVIRIMSIHKSKGLEFPVVFLCGTGKKFNMQDLNKPILLHQDIGFGPKMIDSERKIEYSTLAKEAIRIISKKETISEEMRVLYVALTRAKEKLIITGLEKDSQKSMEEKEQLLNIYEHSENKINSKLVEKYISYLDWLELVYKYHEGKIENIIRLETHKKQDILKGIQKEEKEKTDVQKLLQEEVEQIEKQKWHKEEQERIEKLLQWEYPYMQSSKIPTKTSVTKLKQLEEGLDDVEDLIKETKEQTEQIKLTYMPKFMEQEQRLTPAQKGTLMHLCVQRLDEKKDYTKQEIEDFVQKLYEDEIISEIERKSVNIQALYNYTKSDLFKSLKTAKKVYKEQPFYMNIPAKTIYQEGAEEEQILVQGIIDLYYIDNEDRLVLVDFKTDRIKKGEEKQLEEKYKIQLEIYKKALEETLGRKVDIAMIYALS